MPGIVAISHYTLPVISSLGWTNLFQWMLKHYWSYQDKCNKMWETQTLFVHTLVADAFMFVFCKWYLASATLPSQDRLCLKNNILPRNNDFMAWVEKPPCAQLLLAQECCKQLTFWQLSVCSSWAWQLS